METAKLKVLQIMVLKADDFTLENLYLFKRHAHTLFIIEGLRAYL